MEIRDRLPREGPFRNPGESARDDNLPGKGKMQEEKEEEEEVERGWNGFVRRSYRGKRDVSLIEYAVTPFKIYSIFLYFVIVAFYNYNSNSVFFFSIKKA